MIKVKTIHIEEFRGVRKLDLNLDAKNFGICGPNGTGKSAVVDAVEFCITGDVTRLSGQGSTVLSVKAHAPHVDQHDHPEKAIVTITADIQSLGKSVKITRSVKNPRKVEIIPYDEQVKGVIAELQTHPEFALSRREIIKYIITPPGKRSEDVQTLLRLDYIERLRKNLKTFCNKRKGESDESDRARLRAEVDLKNALKIDSLKKTLVLEKVNDKRKLLNLEDLTELTQDTSFKAGVAVPPGETKKPTLRKAAALADITALQSLIKTGEPSDLAEQRKSAKMILEKLKDDEKALMLARQYGFIKTGLNLITEDACPLCDTEWKADRLRKHLNNKLMSAKETEKLLKTLLNNINAILESLSQRIQSVERTIQYSKLLKPPVEHIELSAYLTDLKNSETVLKGFLEDYSEIESPLQAVLASWWVPTTEQQKRIDECHAAVNDLSDTSSEDEARDILIVAQERYEKLLDATKTVEKQKARSVIAQKVQDHYNTSCTTVLEGIYDKVAADFTKYYCVINREDEEKFVGKLKSAPAKLNFDVDFYGRGLFPPGAYHSEGHQDSMGLCLYLSLMKHTLGEKFNFAVLDDVLMSVDTGHRREVCRLLKSEFPNTQFILTTHDRVWLQFMKTEGLIVRSQTFSGWTVDAGPRVWDDQDIWTEIQGDLDKDDVAKAAWLLRRYLEYTSTILADNLRARIIFRSDGHYDLGDLLPPSLKEWKKKLEKGQKSAVHWKREDEKVALEIKIEKAKELIAKTNAEQWTINPAVHFNEWANLQRHEFQEVVVAFKEMLDNLRCVNTNCKSYLYVMPRKGKEEEMRCNCGTTIINLKVGD